MTAPTKVAITAKQCAACGQEKAASWFYRRRDSTDGLRSRCKPCDRLASGRPPEIFMPKRSTEEASTATEKRCFRCGEVKPMDAFNRNRIKVDGRQGYCAPCMLPFSRAAIRPTRADLPPGRAAAKRLEDRANYSANKDRWYEYRLLKNYGLSMAQVADMNDRNGGRCHSCNDVFDGARRPNVDHCHGCEAVRGLLCRHCNPGIGHFKDDPMRLAAAIVYLMRTHTESPATWEAVINFLQTAAIEGGVA